MTFTLLNHRNPDDHNVKHKQFYESNIQNKDRLQTHLATLFFARLCFKDVFVK